MAKTHYTTEIQPRSDKHLAEQKEEKTRKALVNGGVQVKKDGPVKKLLKIFFTDDPKNVLKRVFKEVVVPDIQNGLANAAKGGIDALIYKDDYRPRDRYHDDEYVSTRRRRKRRNETTADVRTREEEHPKLSNIVYKDRQSAKYVLDQLKEDIEMYTEVPVAAVYEYSSPNFTPYSTDNDVGWKDLSAAEIRSAPNGKYKILYPRPIKI